MIRQYCHIFTGNNFMQAGKYMHTVIFLEHFFPSVGAYKTYGETVLVVEMVFHFSPQFLFETLFTAINI
jgi:hypothetical protein